LQGEVVAVGLRHQREAGGHRTEVWRHGTLLSREEDGVLHGCRAGATHRVLRAESPLVRQLYFVAEIGGGARLLAPL
jgi:hypothetical protein